MPMWGVCLMLILTLLPGLPAEVVPRLTFQYGDPGRAVSTFRLDNVQNYDQLLLSPDEEILYVGARDNVLSLSTKDPGTMRLLKQIAWPSKETFINNCISKAKSNETECFNFIRILLPINDTHLYTCGTNAFKPICTYIDLATFSMPNDSNGDIITFDGKGQSPFDPRHKHTAVIVDGELYTGTVNNFQGNEPIIFRNLGSRTYLKTDASLGWLHSDASFVGSFNTAGSSADSKVYFFFEETAREFDFFDKLTVSRVARVCKNDVGGDKVLQKKWTTFLKAQLTCSDPNDFPFNVLHHVALVHPEDPQRSSFYGVFSSQWQVGGSSSSAVCSFKLNDIEKVFSGHYKEQNKDSSRWTTYTGPVSTPRPGSCSEEKFSDTVLNFMKDHFLMDGKVFPNGGQPLLIKQSVRYVRIAIDSVQAVSRQHYTVMFLGTDQGSIHKSVLVKNGRESHIIEELQLMPTPEPIQNILLAPRKGVLYVGYSGGILQVPLANCSVYRSCFDCILARDPYCAWDRQNKQCRSVHSDQHSSDLWIQDIDSGNPNTTCLEPVAKGRASQPVPDLQRAQNYTVPYNTILKLQCPQGSALANYSWKRPLVKTSEKQIVTFQDTLIIIVRSDTLGLYECWADENGFKYMVAQYWVKDPSGAGISRTGVVNGMDDSNMAINGENGQMSPSNEERNYYKEFVVVTVLLALTLCGVSGLVLYTWRDQIKAKSKIQVCSTPENKKLSGAKGQEKTPFNGTYQNLEFSKPCCGPLAGAENRMDMDNNSVTLITPNEGASEDAVSNV
ncbi:semaphorin-4A isoform 1-T3 [Rhinophrynus dorsalis]